ncbi:MAG: restriction endonuclease subunit S domain-containing protein [Acidimicrobiales bacterium]
MPQEARDLTFAGYLVRFRLLPSFEPRYIEYCASAAFTQQSIRADAVTSTISNFNAERYGNLLLPESDPERQRAIADYLDRETARIDALIDKIDHQVDLFQEHRQTLITAAVTGELDVPGVAA